MLRIPHRSAAIPQRTALSTQMLCGELDGKTSCICHLVMSYLGMTRGKQNRHRRNGTSNQAVAYARVSTAKQVNDGVSLDAQEAKLRKAAQDRNLELLEVIVDAGVSGKDMDRPGMSRLLELVRRREVGYVIIPKLDRLGRSVLDILQTIEMFRDHDVQLLSIAEQYDTTSPHGMLVLRIMASVAELERDMTIQRTIDALEYKKSIGLRSGNVPYGKRLLNPDAKRTGSYAHPEFGLLTDDEGEQAVIAAVRKLRAQNASTQAIADELNLAGFTTRKGTAWKKQYVHAILKNVSGSCTVASTSDRT
jgi:site-specific DNA recombinase